MVRTDREGHVRRRAGQGKAGQSCAGTFETHPGHRRQRLGRECLQEGRNRRLHEWRIARHLVEFIEFKLEQLTVAWRNFGRMQDQLAQRRRLTVEDRRWLHRLLGLLTGALRKRGT